ncbi:MAG: hypothetical protein GZ088_16035 [Acidipila sp.]|nr:hypothetical protein [Acidipila sp.]
MLFRKQGTGNIPLEDAMAAPKAEAQSTGQTKLEFKRLTVPLRMPEHIINQCVEAWFDEEGEVVVELFDSRHGYTVVRMLSEDGLCTFPSDIHVELYDEDPDKPEEVLMASKLPRDNPSELERQKLDEIWIAIDPVDQIVKTAADTPQKPNDVCRCGSEKKYKKCCGRFA